MTLKRWLWAYATTAVIFFALDAIWLTNTVDVLYRPALGHLMSGQVAPAPAALFYVLYFVGIVVFAVAPGLAAARSTHALALGALFGLIAYATYDLTNQASLRDWPWRVTIADLIWGTFVTAIAASGACRITARMVGTTSTSR